MIRSSRSRMSLLAVYVVGLLALTLAPLPHTALALASAQGLDKAVHVVLFGGLAAMIYWNLMPTGGASALRVVLPSGMLAALVELLQASLPYRTADVWDFLWGLAGAVAAYLVLRRRAGRDRTSGRVA